MAIIVRTRDSLLTTSSGYTNYRGILNLVIILLVLSNARAALENIIKYGILVDPLSWFLFLGERSKHWPSLLVILGLGVHILISVGLEKIIAKFYLLQQHKKDSNTCSPSKKQQQQQPSSSSTSPIIYLANAALLINLFACLSLPPLVIYTNDTHPISTSAALMLVSIVFLKLVSYHMLNYWCRDSRKPERLQSRTTKSFLRSYVPPAIDFEFKRQQQQLINNKESQQAVTNGTPPVAKRVQLLTNTTTTTTTTKLSPTKVSPQTNCNHKEVVVKEATSDGQQEQQLRQRKITQNNNNTSDSPSSTTNGHNNSNSSISNRSPSVKQQDTQQALAQYPNNLSLMNMCSFIVYPTLCYELEYARTCRLRKRFLIKRVLELIILSQLDLALIQQWIVPTVSNSVLSFRQMQLSHMLERLLKLAIPNHVIWLIWFYMFFHSLLNIVAELTRFADREFYRDWWNSESVYYFWSNWNIPVHKWCARHLYVPLMSLGLSKCQASTAVFFVSAFFHEYLVSVPLKLFRMWAFTGMLIQLPLARFVSSYFNSYFANVAVWVSLIIGQPLCILMYYHDYYVISINNRLEQS